jgi:hypothetical protein
MSNTKAARLPFKEVTSMSFKAARILAETNRCSVAKRLPPPCAGIPVNVPQPVRDILTKTTAIVVKVKVRDKDMRVSKNKGDKQMCN